MPIYDFAIVQNHLRNMKTKLSEWDYGYIDLGIVITYLFKGHS